MYVCHSSDLSTTFDLSSSSCGIWEENGIDSNCTPENVAEKKHSDSPKSFLQVPNCPGGKWPCFLNPTIKKGCNCDYPCLPFFDPINKCYNANGDILVDGNRNPIILPRRFTQTQKQLVLCLSYLDKDDIDCFIKN